MNDIELLAPAGDMASLIAAVENGADAVYLGGKSFNARQNAGNFDDEEITRALTYCHLRGVKVYVTLNILLKDCELSSVPEYVSFLYNEGVDALIIQDIGAGRLINDIFPGLELHASTQMTAHNLESVELLHNMGYNRVVLSRELSIKEIQYITNNTDIEIEIFSHGALCICYSGQCLMSSMIGGRSGNRGRCAQPCRQKYILTDENHELFEGYIMSPKDLNTIEYLDLLIKSGVKSLKIEGRMKRPEYVAQVISTYRKAIDSFIKTGKAQVADKDKKNLLQIFNRGGFTTGHLFQRGRSEMMSYERPKNWGIYIGSISNVDRKIGKIEVILEEELSKGDGIEIWVKNGENIGFIVESVIKDGRAACKGLKGDKILLEYRGGLKGDKIFKTLDAELIKELEKTYKNNMPIRKVPVNFNLIIERCAPSIIYISDSEGNLAKIEGPVPDEAIKIELNEEKLIGQISKLGGTPFKVDTVSIKIDKGLSLAASTINMMRRNAVEKLEDLRIQKNKPVKVDLGEIKRIAISILSHKVEINRKSIKVSVFLNQSTKVDSAIDGGADIIIFGGDKLRGNDFNYKNAVKKCKVRGIKIYLASPRIIKEEYQKVVDELDQGMQEGADGIYVENLGVLKHVLDTGTPFSTGYSFNVFNLIAAKALEDLGSKFISVSPELSVKELKQIARYIENCEALCYGRTEMMVSEYCPVGAAQGCKGDNSLPLCESGEMAIADRMGLKFPIKTDIYCRSHIYNSKTLMMLEKVKDLLDSGINILRLNMLDENEEDIYKIVKAFKDAALLGDMGAIEMPDNVKDLIEYFKSYGFTKGHYYRSVE